MLLPFFRVHNLGNPAVSTPSRSFRLVEGKYTYTYLRDTITNFCSLGLDRKPDGHSASQLGYLGLQR